jgi:hypothetical protein
MVPSRAPHLLQIVNLPSTGEHPIGTDFERDTRNRPLMQEGLGTWSLCGRRTDFSWIGIERWNPGRGRPVSSASIASGLLRVNRFGLIVESEECRVIEKHIRNLSFSRWKRNVSISGMQKATRDQCEKAKDCTPVSDAAFNRFAFL